MIDQVQTALFSCESLEDLPEIARKIVHFSDKETIWAFYGEMGAGKTTLIKEIASCLEMGDHVSSPTFSLVNEYRSPAGEIIYHFDFYRIKNLEEAIDLGTEEYFYSGNLCLIEWPSLILPLLPERYLRIQITPNGSHRTIQVSKQ